MNTNTTTINALVKEISSAVHLANKSGMGIGSTTQDNFFCVICMVPVLNCTINLDDDDAEFQLKELFKEIDVLVPKKRLFKVLFLSNRQSVFNTEFEVEAFDEKGAKSAGLSELMAERMTPNHFKKPVISVIRQQARSAA